MTDAKRGALSPGWATRQLSEFLTLVTNFDDERPRPPASSSGPLR